MPDQIRPSAFKDTLFAPPDPDLEERMKRNKIIKIVVGVVILIGLCWAGFHFLYLPIASH